MDFTEAYPHSSSLVSFSPGAQFILTALYDALIIRRSDTLQISRTWTVDRDTSPTNVLLVGALQSRPASASTIASLTDPTITHIGWSCDSEYILASCAKRGTVHVFKLRDEEWSSRIDAGAEGLVKAEWAPDGRTILCFSEWGIRVTAWSIVTGKAIYIQFPIHPDRGYAFRSDGRYFVLAERHKSKDTLGVYDTTDSYKLARHFPLPTSSLASLALSPTGNHVAVWEGLLEFKIHFLALTGERLGTFSPEPDPGFGVRHVAWHPNGGYLAVGGWTDKIYILESLSWSPAIVLEVSSRIPTNVMIWREPPSWLEATYGRGFISYESLRGPITVPLNHIDLSRPNSKSGVAQLAWNTNGTLLFARFECVPNAVYLYDFPSPQDRFQPKLRSVLLHTLPVLHARWNPVRKGNLAVCCDGQSVYTWSDEWVGENGTEEEMAECIGIPIEGFKAKDLRWAPDGKGFVLIDRDRFCCAFEIEEKDT
ncbi:WD repeat-containing protein 8 [Amanita muscaria]